MKPVSSTLIAMVLGFFLFLSKGLAADSVSVQLRWLHQFQFAGYYMAKEKGYYRDADLDVALIEGGPQALSPIEDVISGKVDFAITGSGVAIDRMQGKPVVAVAAIMQTSPIVWITLKSSNITTPHDLGGRKVLIMPPPESAELLTMLASEGLDINTMDIQPTSFNIENLVEGSASAYDGYISNEPYFLDQMGIEYNIINPKDYGINFYSDVLITNESLATENPDVVLRFKQATLQGWEYAFRNIEETIQLIHQQYAPGKSIEHLRFEALTIRNLVMPELVQIGHMNPGRWQFIADSYRNLNMTKAPAELAGFLFKGPESPDYSLAFKVAFFSAVLLTIASLIILKFRSLSLQLAKTNELLAEQAVTDQLTQVSNRRGLEIEAGKIINLVQRKQMPCSFMMIDIDHFKRINDEYGHHAGDEALIVFARTLKSYRRQHDVVARVGGEEFAVLLIDTTTDDALKLAEKFLDDVSQQAIVGPDQTGSFRMTASIGIAAVDGSFEQVWQNADKALYQAKDKGRNTVVVV